jgi:sporulation protein YlmC with PRC-barrel domain
MNASMNNTRADTMPSGHTAAIRAKKVIGTNVYDTTGEKLGSIDDIVLDKRSNNIMFAVCAFGGFLGMGEKYHAIPWGALNYDEGNNGYVVNFTADQLRAGPADTVEALTRDNGIAYRDTAYNYYKTPKYW